MTLWWIGNAILLVVVVPVLVALLNRVLAALERIRAATDDILDGAPEQLFGAEDRAFFECRHPDAPGMRPRLEVRIVDDFMNQSREVDR